MKIRKIKNDCMHDDGFLFTIDVEIGQCWSPETGCDSSSIRLNRYCKDCRTQMGTKDLDLDDKELSKVEFTSPEMEAFFEGDLD